MLRGYFLDRAGKSTSHDMALAKKAEREGREEMKEVREKLKKTQTLNIELGESDDTVFSLVDINKATLTAGDRKLFDDFTRRITNQDKVLLNGRNGTGKSSLLKAIHKLPGYHLESES